MKFCFHKWSRWGGLYASSTKRSRGSFGETSTDDVVCQDKTRSKCGKVKTRIVRDGRLDAESPEKNEQITENRND